MVASPRSRKKLSPAELTRFLRLLAATGNFALACDRLGRAKSGLYKRRRWDPLFAAECRHALTQARSTLWRGGAAGASAPRPMPDTILSAYAGRPQLRRVAPGTLTRAGQQHFLRTLAATGNVRFAAASVGVAHSSILARRDTHPPFAAAMRTALQMARSDLQLRVLKASGLFSERDENPHAIANLTIDQALRFLALTKRSGEG